MRADAPVFPHDVTDRFENERVYHRKQPITYFSPVFPVNETAAKAPCPPGPGADGQRQPALREL